MHSLMGLVGAAGGAVVLTMEVVSLVTPEWVYFTRIADRSQGLWQLCTTLGCISYTEGKSLMPIKKFSNLNFLHSNFSTY